MRRAASPAARADGGVALLVIVVLGFLARLWLTRSSGPGNMDPDSAHFLNIARCFARGQGFSNPAAWPAWIHPARLPMPETFKEPAYPWLIAHLEGTLGGGFRAGQWLSVAAGTLLPWLTFALGRRRGLGRGTALLAAGLVAASPLALAQSVRVMVDASFAAVVTAMFLCAAAWADDRSAPRPLARDLLAGALFGLAFLFRAQTMFLALPLVVLLAEGRAPGKALVRVALAVAAAVAVASPLWLRNLRLFHTPLYSDVVAYGLWPYVDHLQFSHGLEHPPAILPFVLGHIPAVIKHSAWSCAEFFVHTVPEEIIGHALWMPALAAGLLLSLRTPGRWAFAYLYVGLTLVFIMAVHWDARYFTSAVPLWALWTALGATAFARALGGLALVGPVRAPAVLGAAALVACALQLWTARREVRGTTPPELDAARREAAFLDAHLLPEEAVLAVTTSYWSWFVDRPSVHLVIADRARFDGVMERLKVRWAALPTSRLAEFAARYPGGVLPATLVFDHADSAEDVSVFRVVPGAALPTAVRP